MIKKFDRIWDSNRGTQNLYIYHTYTARVSMCVSSWAEPISFYPRDAMLARVIEIATCLSVRLSVCHAPILCQNEES